MTTRGHRPPRLPLSRTKTALPTPAPHTPLSFPPKYFDAEPNKTNRWTFVAAAYNQEAGNATLYVDGVAVTAQTSIPNGGVFLGDEVASSSFEQQPSDLLAGGSSNATGGAAFSTALRVGAGPSVVGAADGSTGFIGVVDEAFVYGTALSVDELDYLYRAAQVRRKEAEWYASYT